MACDMYYWIAGRSVDWWKLADRFLRGRWKGQKQKRLIDFSISLFRIWWPLSDLNRRPSDYEIFSLLT
ncbi:hypothetical protein C9J47_22275 [Photobacterium indicum]|uniref:Uncharacterized protein n=1 Tax=Photobacterium indicum TaxID=81447 RepID=A0A2T3L3D2_9GAMM|nr:hypothetical protein C9J47_22275 [Photobacterium indicum]